MLVEPVVPCPQVDEDHLLCSLMIAVFLFLGLEERADDGVCLDTKLTNDSNNFGSSDGNGMGHLGLVVCG